MAPFAVVERLDVLEDGGARRRSSRPTVPVHEVELESREEALCDRVVPAVARPTQAGTDAMALRRAKAMCNAFNGNSVRR